MTINKKLILPVILVGLIAACRSFERNSETNARSYLLAADKFRQNLLRKKQTLHKLTAFIAGRSKLTEKQIEAAIRGHGINKKAGLAFIRFAGYWQGKWKGDEPVKQHWQLPANLNPPGPDCNGFCITTYQTVKMNGGFGWNAVVMSANGRPVILGSVVHYDKRTNKPVYSVPHLGIAVSYTELVWITPKSIFWETISNNGPRTKRLYNIRQYNIQNLSRVPRLSFSTVYSETAKAPELPDPNWDSGFIDRLQRIWQRPVNLIGL